MIANARLLAAEDALKRHKRLMTNMEFIDNLKARQQIAELENTVMIERQLFEILLEIENICGRANIQ